MHRRDARHLGPHTRCVSAAATAGAYQHRHSTHRLRPPCPSRMQTGCTREPARRERRRGRADFAPCGSREDCVTTRRANHRDRAGPASPALGRRLLAACHTTSRQRVSAVTQACQRVPAGVGPFWRAGVGSFSRAPKVRAVEDRCGAVNRPLLVNAGRVSAHEDGLRLDATRVIAVRRARDGPEILAIARRIRPEDLYLARGDLLFRSKAGATREEQR